MELVHPRCAGLDVSKRDAKVCVRIAGLGRAALLTGGVDAVLLGMSSPGHVRDVLTALPGVDDVAGLVADLRAAPTC